jgi:transposase
MLGGFDDSLAVKTNKNDAADAEAICEAVGRPNMHFVPIKSIDAYSTGW